MYDTEEKERIYKTKVEKRNEGWFLYSRFF